MNCLTRTVSPPDISTEKMPINFKLDSNENDGELLSPPDNQDSALAGGFASIFHTPLQRLERHLRNQPRIKLMTQQLDFIEFELDEELIQFLQAKRTAEQPIESLADLVGATITITEEGNINQGVQLRGSQRNCFQLFETFTLQSQPNFTGQGQHQHRTSQHFGSIPWNR